MLWIAPSWLGDAVLSLPALQCLQAHGIEVDVLARRGTERVFTDSAARVHGMSPTRRARRLVTAWRLRPRAYAVGSSCHRPFPPRSWRACRAPPHVSARSGVGAPGS